MMSLCTCAASGKLWNLLRNNLHLLDLQLLLDALNAVEQKLLQEHPSTPPLPPTEKTN